MAKALEMKPGTKFNLMTFTGGVKKGKIGREYEFQCDCGEKKFYKSYYVADFRSGRIKSCGCQQMKSKYSGNMVKGARFERLTLTGKEEVRLMTGHHRRYFECVCDCGKIVWARANGLISGKYISCGCLNDERLIERITKHGHSKKNGGHLLYGVHQQMISRCYREKHKHYKSYGGRGVRVCDEWRNDFMSFFNWAIENGWREGLSVDKDIKAKALGIPALLYSPEMCTIVDQPTQMRNTSRNIDITAFGETKCLKDWSLDQRCMVTEGGLRVRIKKLKWDAERSITTPPANDGFRGKKNK